MDPEAESAADHSLSEDLAAMFAALTGMTADIRAALDTLAPGCSTLPGCPLCRLTSVVTEASPEVKDHLSSALGSLLLALGAALRPPPDDPPSPGFQRINLGGDDTTAPDEPSARGAED